MVVYGIDLGTTYSCIAKIKAERGIIERPDVIIRNRKDSFPSVVFFDPKTGTPLVGDGAKERLRVPRFAGQTVAFFKTSIGKEEYCKDHILLNDKVRMVSPVEGSACILHYLYRLAEIEERGLGHSPTNMAVITIPAGFTNKQRMCTKIAAEKAGLNVLALIHEPTAAAISYDIGPNETILVFDLGGGTLDVSIVTKQSGTYKVLASASDYDVFKDYIGGKKWDEALINLAIDRRNDSKEGLSKWNRDKENRAQEGQLRMAAEECKIQLSDSTSYDYVFPDMESVTIYRSTFERYTKKLVKDCVKVVESAISQLADDIKINRCVLAGGASNMPMIKVALQRILAERVSNSRNEDEWLCVTRPSRAIAEGAALYARQIALGEANDSGIVIEEKSSHSYGTSLKGERVGLLIKSTDPMIFEGEETYYPIESGQESIPVDVFECDRDDDDIPIGEATKIMEKYYTFPKEIKVATDTAVKFKVKRDKNGIIKIRVACEGGEPEEYEVSTIISSKIEDQITNSIELMDKQIK